MIRQIISYLLLATLSVHAILLLAQGQGAFSVAQMLHWALMLICLMGYMGLRNSLKAEAFIQHLTENQETIKRHGWHYNGFLITTDTKLAQFHYTFSLILLTLRVPSRIYIVSQEPVWPTNVLYSFMNLLFGWWALPLGPFYTLAVLVKNIKGGDRVGVGELLEVAREKRSRDD